MLLEERGVEQWNREKDESQFNAKRNDDDDTADGDVKEVCQSQPGAALFYRQRAVGSCGVRQPSSGRLWPRSAFAAAFFLSDHLLLSK